MRRVFAGLFAVLLVVAMLPANKAQAVTLSGYTSKVDYDNTDPNRYKIEIDLTNQIITVYEQNSSGQYTNIALQGLCTTGNAENPTGAGTFKLGHLKERFGYFVAFGQYAQYWSQVVRGVYIHSVMYDSKDVTKISKSAYNGLGKALSHGCVRVLPAHAKWIFYNCPPGTVCQITKKAANASLVQQLKSQKPGISSARHVADFKSDPPVAVAAITASGVPVRTGFSSVKDSTVMTLSKNDQVTVLQIGPDWCKVQTSNGKLGYVQTQYLYMNVDALYATHGGYVATDNTALYSYPSTSSSTLASIPKGAEVDVIGTVDKYWLTARVDGAYGYVRVKLLKKGGATKPDGSDTSVVPAAPAPPTSGQAYIKDGIIANFRSGPGSSYSIIGELYPGTEVTLLEVSGNWYRAVVDGYEGYISAVCIAFG